MNKFFPKILNGLIFIVIILQAIIYYLNTKPSSKVYIQKSISVENFSSIVLTKSGITKIGSEKLNKIDEKMAVTHQAVSFALIQLKEKLTHRFKFKFTNDNSWEKISIGQQSLLDLFKEEICDAKQS